MTYDTLYINGKIFTSSDDTPFVEAMAVKNGRIVWTGAAKDAPTNEVAPESEAVAAEVVDLAGACVVPGFVDSHQHALEMADAQNHLLVLPPNINSIEELIENVAQVREEQGPDLPVYGWGFEEGKLAELRTPNKYDLDRAVTDVPVVIFRSCVHVAAVNSKALELLNITKDTPDPQGGKIGRDENGEPNGILYETAATAAKSLFPVPTAEATAENLVTYGNLLSSQGVTTAAEMGSKISFDYRIAFKKAQMLGFKTKIGFYYRWTLAREDENFVITAKDQSPENQIRIAGVKLFGDGSIGGKTAWFHEPYYNVDTYGAPVCTEEDIDEAIAFAKKYKCQVAIHAIGNKAIDTALDHFCAEDSWMNEPVPTFRIEHAGTATPEAVQRAVKSSVAFNGQPIFLYAEITSHVGSLGLERTQKCYPMKSWMEAGLQCCISTDAPATSWVTPTDPMVSLKAATTRIAWNGTDCGQDEIISLEDAIKLYTRESAKVLGFTNTGVLAPGYCADFVILDRDIFQIPCADLDQVKVKSTFINGEKVYDAN